MGSAKKRILIIGAGPTGLGAAHRALESGQAEPFILERAPIAGGLAASFTDEAGFTWDCGSHLQFSHYEYFDDALSQYIGDSEWSWHERKTFVWVCDRFVPYPLQLHTDHLPDREKILCEEGLASAGVNLASAGNFLDWIEATQGPAICDLFMRPYNEKVWACDLTLMSADWIAERVAVPRTAGATAGQHTRSWGPNSQFRYPKTGGSGFVWRRLAELLPERALRLGESVVDIDHDTNTVYSDTGHRYGYDAVVSTIPLPEVARLAGLKQAATAADELCRTTTHVVGIGLEGQPPTNLRDWLWGYFPQDDVPFYRLTVLSSLSDDLVPCPGESWSLMVEIAESPERPLRVADPCQAVVDSLGRLGFIQPATTVLSRWYRRLPYGYPVPTLNRDALVSIAHNELERHGIYSRGRFGAWKYEVSNQDHSFMQGVEAVDRILTGTIEPTLIRPNEVNRSYNRISERRTA